MLQYLNDLDNQTGTTRSYTWYIPELYDDDDDDDDASYIITKNLEETMHRNFKTFIKDRIGLIIPVGKTVLFANIVSRFIPTGISLNLKPLTLLATDTTKIRENAFIISFCKLCMVAKASSVVIHLIDSIVSCVWTIQTLQTVCALMTLTMITIKTYWMIEWVEQIFTSAATKRVEKIKSKVLDSELIVWLGQLVYQKSMVHSVNQSIGNIKQSCDNPNPSPIFANSKTTKKTQSFTRRCSSSSRKAFEVPPEEKSKPVNHSKKYSSSFSYAKGANSIDHVYYRADRLPPEFSQIKSTRLRALLLGLYFRILFGRHRRYIYKLDGIPCREKKRDWTELASSSIHFCFWVSNIIDCGKLEIVISQAEPKNIKYNKQKCKGDFGHVLKQRKLLHLGTKRKRIREDKDVKGEIEHKRIKH